MKKYKSYFIYLVTTLALTGLYLLLRPNKAVMNAVTNTLAPVKSGLSWLCDFAPFSVGEIIIVAVVLLALYFVVSTIVKTVKAKKKGQTLAKRALFALCFSATVWLLMCLMYGAGYYSDSFLDKSGMKAEGGTEDELYKVTELFARKASETSSKVERDSNGAFSVPISAVIADAKGVYAGAEQEFPFLKAPERTPKKLIFSRALSYMNFTGFYFPFTAEANINADCPAGFVPATVAHELAHQRGVNTEQEANFASIIACTTSGKAEYEYSGWLLGYVYLSNELYAQNSERFNEVYALLSDGVKADLRVSNEYWARFETVVSEISDMTYDSFLKGNGQDSGIKSYGEVVDLLLAYYK